MAPFILKFAVAAVNIVEIFLFVHRKENPSINNGMCGYKFINAFNPLALELDVCSLAHHLCNM
jgi:hypothetical protein